MNAWGWSCLIVGALSILGIFYIDWRYQQRDRAERDEPDDGDWFV